MLVRAKIPLNIFFPSCTLCVHFLTSYLWISSVVLLLHVFTCTCIHMLVYMLLTSAFRIVEDLENQILLTHALLLYSNSCRWKKPLNIYLYYAFYFFSVLIWISEARNRKVWLILLFLCKDLMSEWSWEIFLSRTSCFCCENTKFCSSLFMLISV